MLESMTFRRLSSCFLLLPVLVLACTTFDTAAVDGGAPDATAADGEVRLDAGGPSDGAAEATRDAGPFTCNGTAWLCDDFEDPAFPKAPWALANFGAGSALLLKDVLAPSPSQVMLAQAPGGGRGRLSASHDIMAKAVRCVLEVNGRKRGDSEALLLQVGVQGAIAQYQVTLTVTTGDTVRVQGGGNGLDDGGLLDTPVPVPLSMFGSWHHVEVEVGMRAAAKVRVVIDGAVVLSSPTNGLDALRMLGDSTKQFIHVGAAPSAGSGAVWEVAYDNVRCDDR